MADVSDLPNDENGKLGCVDESEYVHLVVDGKNIVEIYPTQYNENTACRFTSSPAENGTETIDGKFLLPTTVHLTGVVKSDGYAVVDTIKAAVRTNRKVICTFYGKAGKIDDMLIESLQTVGSAQRVDAVEITISLRQWMGVDPAK